jgi:hypothetical protein
MKHKIEIIDINSLIPHEHIDEDNLEKVKNNIEVEKIIKKPILVDKKSKVILDGHHRYNSLKLLGCSKIPVLLVNYHSKKINLGFFRNIYEYVTKYEIIECAKCGNLFPKKTTRHTHSIKNPKIQIKITELI